MTTRTDDPDDGAFARAAQSDVFGKLDDEIPPIRINGDVRIELRRLAAASQMNESEFVRNLCHVRVYGLEHVLRLQAERLQRAVGNAEQMQSKVPA